MESELVADVNGTYVSAGADVIETNAFGANRVTFINFGLIGRLVDINAAGVRLA